MRTKLIVFIIVVGLGIVGAFGWVGYELFTTGFSAKAKPHAVDVFLLQGAAALVHIRGAKLWTERGPAPTGRPAA